MTTLTSGVLRGRPIAGLISTWLPWLPIVAVHRSKDLVIQEEWDAGEAHGHPCPNKSYTASVFAMQTAHSVFASTRGRP